MHSVKDKADGDHSPYRFFSEVHYSVSMLEDRQQITETAKRVVSQLKCTERDLQNLTELGARVLTNARNATECYAEEEERRLADNYQSLEDGLLELIQVFAGMEDSAVCDSRLDGVNEKRVTAAFKRVINLMKEVFSVTQEIRWAIMENVESIDEIASSESIDKLIARL